MNLRGGQIALGAMTALAAATGALAGEWKWNITPYLWATGVTTDLTVNDSQIASGDISFSDLIDKVDFTAQVHAEGQIRKNGIMADAFYVKLGDDDRQFAVPPVPGATATAGGDFELTIVELGGIFNPTGDQRGFSLLYGARAVARDADIDVTFDLGPGGIVPRRYELEKTLYDALVGVRWTGRIADHWSYQLRADASSGGSNLIWSAGAGFVYSFGESDRYGVVTGYRHMDLDFDAERGPAEIQVDGTLSGFLAGFRFSF